MCELKVAGVLCDCVGGKFPGRFLVQLVNDKGQHMATGEEQCHGTVLFRSSGGWEDEMMMKSQNLIALCSVKQEGVFIITLVYAISPVFLKLHWYIDLKWTNLAKSRKTLFPSS